MAERFSAALCWSAALLVIGAFAWLLGDVIAGGLNALSWSFLIEPTRDAGRAGGIAPMIVSTLLLLFVALAAAWPIGLLAAIWLSEFARRYPRFERIVQGSLTVLAGMPSIVFGLFGNAFFAVTLGLGFSIVAGGLTLACMILPILIRVMEDGVRAVPERYRHAAVALGLSPFAVIRHVLIPAAIPGLAAGTVLGIARAMAETAALIFTSGYVDRMPGSLLDSGRAISVHIYDLAMNIPGGERNAYGSALVLVLMLLLINGAVAVAGRRWFMHRSAIV